jgi:6-pyruvoyl-tetrahydropterin synthase
MTTVTPPRAWHDPESGETRHGIRLYKEYFNFGSAHFLIFADGTREELHGHNYRATLEIDAELDEAWLVADFLVVKPIFRAVCDSLDHRTLFPTANPHLRVEAGAQEVVAWFGDERYVVPTRDVKLLPIENTSSELLAGWICGHFLVALREKLPALTLRRVAVTVQESPGQSAMHERAWPRHA